MQILQSENFTSQLNNILDFINTHSEFAKNEFKKDLKESLHNLKFMPYKYRQSISFNDKNIRDFIFKGYVIPYLIDKDNNIILILAIFKSNIFKPSK